MTISVGALDATAEQMSHAEILTYRQHGPMHMSFGQMLDEKPGIRIFVDAKCCHRSFCRCRQINCPYCTMQSQLILVWQHVFIFYAAKWAHVASRFLVRFMAFMPDVVAFLEPLRFVTLPDLAGRGVECSPHGSTGGCSRLVWWCLAYIPQIGSHYWRYYGVCYQYLQ